MSINEVKLGNISKGGKGTYGIAASTKDAGTSKYTYLRITDITDDGELNLNSLASLDDPNASKYLLAPGDIVFARTGASTGRSYFYDGSIPDMVYAGFLIKYSLDETKVNPKYIKYYCISKQYKDWISSSLTGSTRGNINEQQLREMPIPVPERSVQDSVVRILDSITESIKANNRTNDNLYKIGRSIYDHYEATESKRVPVKKILNFTRGFEPGSASYKEDKNGQTVRFIRVGDMDSLAGSTFIDKKIASIFAEPNDILISFDASIGRVAFGVCGAYSTGIRKVYSVKNDIPKSFIYYYLTSKNAQDTISENATGTTIKQASKAIDYMTMPFSEKTSGIYQALDSIFDKQLSIKAENERLTKLRDTLLPELLNGKIDVSNIDI